MAPTNPLSLEDEADQTVHLPFLTTASTPVTPGPSTPTAIRSNPLEHGKVDDIILPLRPSSTPFPQNDLLESKIHCSRRSNESGSDYRGVFSIEMPKAPSSLSTLCNLPTEIHECILDHLFGVRGSASSRTPCSMKSKALRSWGTALRHSRRREVSELALVSNTWRHLIQDRLYRHLKIKGTSDFIEESTSYFLNHTHLCPYVKHVEIWFPVFQQKGFGFDRTLRIPSTTPDRSNLVRSLAHLGAEPGNSVTYQSPANNCTLEEIFQFIRMTFSEACILTLEGGERKKPPMVRYFFGSGETKRQLPILQSIRTFLCKGQWNIIRSNDDFQTIAAALPMLNEWHGSYGKPKSKSYLCMSTILPKLPLNLTHLNICMEADYRREAMCPAFFRKVTQKTHFCMELAKAVPTLEHLAFTGRVCHCFFDFAARLTSRRDSRLKSVDLVVKNCCRSTFQWNDGTGITDMAFIMAFEALVLSGVRALDKLGALDFLRIRFIDLGTWDSEVVVFGHANDV